MKKYKLIKEYPGSPKLGIIYDTSLFLFNNYKNYPEFWEEVIEKNYEILSLQCIINPNRGLIYTVRNGELINSNGSPCYYSIENALEFWAEEHKSWVIHSVKRLSDGEIFTIGDKIRFINESLEETYPCRIIKNFKIKENTLISICDDNNVEILLKNLKKVKQPLFTTEDGVDIFENRGYYYIDSIWQIIPVNSTTVYVYYKNNKTFSTKEKAEEYILLNKPCLSIKEISEIYISLKNNKSSKQKQELINLVKNKLNL